MKTKEIIRYMIIPQDLDSLDSRTRIELFNKPLADNGFYSEVKLVIPLPEKKIEITESEFDAAIRLYGARNLDLKTYSGFVQTLKRELGFLDED